MPAPWNNDPLPVHHQLIGEQVPYTSAETPKAASTTVGVGVPSELPRARTRTRPLTHPSVDAPICVECHALENTFFDPGCAGCKESLLGAEIIDESDPVTDMRKLAKERRDSLDQQRGETPESGDA